MQEGPAEGILSFQRPRVLRPCFQVHYLSREQMRAPIEDTGAHFTNELEECPELYEGSGQGRKICMTWGSALPHLCREAGRKTSLVPRRPSSWSTAWRRIP